MSYTRSKRKHRKRQTGTSKPRAGGSRSSSKSDAGKLDDERMFTSNRSVFYDICDTPEEAHNLTLRSELIIQIEQIIRRRNLTQNRAAKLFGVTQPRISDLIRGKIDLFSLDTLITMLTRAGVPVHLVIEQTAA